MPSNWLSCSVPLISGSPDSLLLEIERWGGLQALQKTIHFEQETHVKPLQRDKHILRGGVSSLGPSSCFSNNAGSKFHEESESAKKEAQGSHVMHDVTHKRHK